MQSIADYKNNQDEFYKIEESNKDYTEELEDNNDDNVDYNYNYENSQTVKDLENWAGWGGGDLVNGRVC